MSEPPPLTNEVIMEAMRIKSSVKLADVCVVTDQDVAANFGFVDSAVGDEVVRRQVVLVALAFAYPQAIQPM